MSKYLNVEAVKKHGQPIDRVAPGFQHVPAGHILVAIERRTAFENAVIVTEPREYERVYTDYRAGTILGLSIYSLDESLVDQCKVQAAKSA